MNRQQLKKKKRNATDGINSVHSTLFDDINERGTVSGVSLISWQQYCVLEQAHYINKISDPLTCIESASNAVNINGIDSLTALLAKSPGISATMLLRENTFTVMHIGCILFHLKFFISTPKSFRRYKYI